MRRVRRRGETRAGTQQKRDVFPALPDSEIFTSPSVKLGMYYSFTIRVEQKMNLNASKFIYMYLCDLARSRRESVSGA